MRFEGGEGVIDVEVDEALWGIIISLLDNGVTLVSDEGEVFVAAEIHFP